MFQDIPRPGLWKRLLLGGVLCIFAAAAYTPVMFMTDLARALPLRVCKRL